MTDRPGPTGDFPHGKLDERDEGGLLMQIAHDGTNLRIDFGKPVTWLAMPTRDAVKFAVMILNKCGVRKIEPLFNSDPGD